MTNGLSEVTLAQTVPVAKSRETVRSTKTPFSPCNTASRHTVEDSINFGPAFEWTRAGDHMPHGLHQIFGGRGRPRFCDRR